jgi:hypothetical protein
MSLAMFAASINDNSNITLPNYENNDNILNQKRHKRTQRKYPKIENFDANKVNSILKQIHNSNEDEEEDENNYSFQPPPNPQSMGADKTNPTKENFIQSFSLDKNANVDKPATAGKAPSPNDYNDNLDLNNYNNYGDKKSAEEYYKSVLSGYNGQKNAINRPYHNSSQNEQPISYTGDDILLKKLNYMISLLEEQKDEKTNNVTEEVILYSFIGIFIIFMADVFVKTGKYTR